MSAFRRIDNLILRHENAIGVGCWGFLIFMVAYAVVVP